MTKTAALTVGDLENLKLLYGSHTRREEGVCIMEAVAWLAGEKHSDEQFAPVRVEIIAGAIVLVRELAELGREGAACSTEAEA